MRTPRFLIPTLLMAMMLVAGADVRRASAATDLQNAAAPLVNFAGWCAKNKSKSVGVAALDQAKAIAADGADIDTVAKLLASAADDLSADPVVAQKKAVAYEAAAVEFDRIISRNSKADDVTVEAWQIKAIELSPRNRANKLPAMMDKAAKADRMDGLQRLYALAISLDETGKQSFKAAETVLIEKGLLPEVAAKVVDKVLEKKRSDLGAAFLIRIAPLDGAGFSGGKYEAAVQKLCNTTTLLQARGHAMTALVSLPKKWDPTQKSPILLCYEGAGCNYDGLHNAFKGVVGDGPYIVVTPITFSNTLTLAPDKFAAYYPLSVVAPYNNSDYSGRMQFDEPGSVAILKTVHDMYNTEGKIYVTGFSGGGTPCYVILAALTDVVAAGAPACANYYANWSNTSKSAGAPIQQFFGEKDPYNDRIQTSPGVMPQGNSAATMLTSIGYRVRPLKIVPNMGHDCMAEQVVAFFNEVRDAAKKKAGN